MSAPKTVCVVGLGLIGGSIAAGLTSRGGTWRVRGVDRRRSTMEIALRNGFIDETAASVAEGVRDADLVVLATPVVAIRELLAELGGLLRPGQVVTDVGSSKGSIVAAAAEHLAEGVGFVGGHPIAGGERSGIGKATAGLFDGRTCILTPGDATSASALQAVTELWQTLAAQVVLLSPEAHDRVFALVSHLPHLVAYGLVETVASELEPQQLALAGGALRDFTRVAQSPPGLWRDVALENRDALLRAIDDFASRLAVLREAIATGAGDDLFELFERAAAVRGRPWML